MKGVTKIERKGSAYFYARVGGQRVYCGKGEKGRKLAEAARSKHVTAMYENRELQAGLRVKKADLKTFRDLANWYMSLPNVQEKASYQRKVTAAAHLLDYFKDKALGALDVDDQEHYRSHRRGQGAADSTIDYDIEILSAMFHAAVKRKKIPRELMPGEFVQVREIAPRRKVTEAEFEALLKQRIPTFRTF